MQTKKAEPAQICIILQGYFWDGPEPCYEKTMSDRVIDFIFWQGPIHLQAIKIWCSFCCKVDIKVSWAHQFLQMTHLNFKWPIKILIFTCK